MCMQDDIVSYILAPGLSYMHTLGACVTLCKAVSLLQ